MSSTVQATPGLQAVAVVIPALNEAQSLSRLLPLLAPLNLGQVIVGDNGSTDATAAVARAAGCMVALEPRRGYGAACAAALSMIRPGITAVVFLDADLSDDPTLLPELAGPVLRDEADLVIGCRDAALQERGAMTPPQRFGTWLATWLIRRIWGYAYRDLGPFRAIRLDRLREMQMRDRAFGWTVEMQVRALQMGLRIQQISVPYRKRVGVSKISGTVRGVALAGYYILSTIARLALDGARPPATANAADRSTA